ncbi:MAG: adenylyl-sulfate kinase [Gammaproteobacteria bacterium]|nr:adenylyl-sulfate kinase [Gammaproteobacteria bacterium]
MKRTVSDVAEVVKATNITWHHGHVGRPARQALLRQRGATLWFTGLSASGKSTIAFTFEHMLVERGYLAYVLDGDNVRHGLNKNLGFSAEDRAENIRRIGEVAKLFADAGVITMTSFISPYRSDRKRVRDLHEEAGLPFLEVYTATPLSVCEDRDPKGLYRRARAGELKLFTGIDDPYEPPETPEIVLDAHTMSAPDCAQAIMKSLEDRGVVNPTP